MRTILLLLPVSWIWPGPGGPCNIKLIHISILIGPFYPLSDVTEALAYYKSSKKLIGAHHGGPNLKYIEIDYMPR